MRAPSNGVCCVAPSDLPIKDRVKEVDPAICGPNLTVSATLPDAWVHSITCATDGWATDAEFGFSCGIIGCCSRD